MPNYSVFLLGTRQTGVEVSRVRASMASISTHEFNQPQLYKMPPRKSLPAASSVSHRPTPKRGQSSTPRAINIPNGTAPRKRLRRTETEDDLESIEAEHGPEAPVTRQSNGVKAETEASGAMDPEKELEHWQDFAVEHYEMVEQLPLELHRNYRLLRELDDGVAGRLSLSDIEAG